VSAAYVLVAGAPAMAAPARGPTKVAQASAGDARAATERVRQRVDAAARAGDAARAEKAALAGEYEKQLAEIDRLKQGRASWRRERLLRTHMSESHGTARKLAALDERIRRHEAQVARERRAFIQAIDRELAQEPAPARRAALMRWRASARRGLEPGVRKIVLPDDEFDPLADPEELEYQASLLRQGEEQLTRELARLDTQADRYRRMVALRKQRNRAAELSGFDHSQPRRSTGRTDLRTGEAAAAPVGEADGAPLPQAPPGDSAPGQPADVLIDDGTGPTEDPMFDVVLADVVDASTVSALRAAGLSSDPAVKAQAAERARKQVKERLDRLQKRREMIQKRARVLRRQ
jgi:hypothetical protein